VNFKWLQNRIGPGTVAFIQRTTLTMGAFLFSKVFTTISIILLGRWIGEDGIGRSWGIVAGGMVLAALLSAGVPPTLNVFIPRGPTDGRAEWTTGLTYSLIISILFFIAYPIIELPLRVHFDLSHTEITLAVFIGITSNAFNLATAAIQGLNLARARVHCELLMSVSAATITISLARWGDFRELALPIGMLSGMFIGLIPAIPYLIPRTRWDQISLAPLRLMAGYSIFALLCGLGGLFASSLQRIQIKRLMSDSDLGLYGMASQASIGLAYTAAAAISAILISKTAARSDKLQVMRHILRTWLVLAPGIVVVMFLGQYVALWLAGFPFHGWLAVYLAVASLLIMVHTTLGNVMSGHGLWGSIVGVAFSGIHATAIWTLTEWLVPVHGVAGGALALIGGYLLIIVLAVLGLPWFFRLPDFSGDRSEQDSTPVN
jgi:O-antigen/teichoic acid export membrane protein